ncbi:hypothetical protein SMMN14_00249 [Sphaerulina musiva]
MIPRQQWNRMRQFARFDFSAVRGVEIIGKEVSRQGRVDWDFLLGLHEDAAVSSSSSTSSPSPSSSSSSPPADGGCLDHSQTVPS